MDKKVYIILPVHNRKPITDKFIQCLKLQSCKNYHLILVDDGSTDGTSESVQQQLDNCTTIKGKGHWWWAGSINKAFEWIDIINPDEESPVLIINDDVIIEKDFLANGLELISKLPDTLLLARHYIQETDEIIESGVEADLKRLAFKLATSGNQINCLSTRGLLLKWKDIKKIGRFREKLLPHYCTDYEYTIRAYKKGFSLVTAPEFFLICNIETTGMRKIEKGAFVDCYKRLFNRKSALNPLYWTNLAILICPWPWVLPNIIKIWLRAGRNLLRCAELRKA